MKSTISQSYDIIYEDLIKKQHILDSLNLLIFNILLILALLTVWLFKHRRIPYLHETGLALIYGLIAGAIIKYGVKRSFSSQLTAKVQLKWDSKNYSADFFPTDLLLSLHGDSVNFSKFSYKLASRVLYRPSLTENTELENKLTFDPEVFFNVILPPIIFNAGYSLNRANFFNNFGTIATFAFIGTVISSFVAGCIFFALTLIWPSLGFKFNDCLFFGATISATDPVTVLAIFSDLRVESGVYSLVFGESVLNDAIAMVLAMTIDKYVGIGGAKINFISFLNTIWSFCTLFMGSLLIGFSMGFVTAIMTKFTKIREFPLLETSLFFLMSYSTFLIAEVSQLSGIVAVLFAGIFQAHYTYHNLSKLSQHWTKRLYELMSFLVENFIFCYIGLSMFTFQNHKFHLGLIISAFIAIFVARMCNVYPLSFILNLGRNRPIPLNTQHTLMFSGLRGAMAFALAIRNTSTPQRRAIYTTTSIIVIITVLFCGSLTPTVLSLLNIKTGVSDPPLQYPDDYERRKSTNLSNKKSHDEINRPNAKISTDSSNGIIQSDTTVSGFDAAKYQRFKNANSNLDLTNRNASVNVSTEDTYEQYSCNRDDLNIMENTWKLEDSSNVIPDSYSHNFLFRIWGHLDYKFLKPLLTQTNPSLMVTLPKFWLPIAKAFTTAEQMRRNTESQLIVSSFGTNSGSVGGNTNQYQRYGGITNNNNNNNDLYKQQYQKNNVVLEDPNNKNVRHTKFNRQQDQGQEIDEEFFCFDNPNHLVPSAKTTRTVESAAHSGNKSFYSPEHDDPPMIDVSILKPI